MTIEQKTVLIVDDSLFDAEILKEHLKREFRVVMADGGEAALRLAVQEPRPDVILLDVMMPGLDGYATCRRLKDDFETQDIDVIFISANTDIEEKLVGYEVGGSDYLTKPVKPLELMQKIRLAVRNQEFRQRLEEEKNQAARVAMTAITSAGEQGEVLDFMRAAFACKTAEELPAALLASVERYGLQSLLQLRDGDQKLNYADHGECTSLECSILDYASGTKHMYQMGARFIVNYPHVTLLASDLPLDDSDQVGRLRDYLGIIAECAEGRFVALKSEERRVEQLKALVEAAATLTGALQIIESRQREYLVQIQAIADKYLTTLEGCFVHLGLSEAQENYLIEMAREMQLDVAQRNDFSSDVIKQLRTVIDRLQRLASRKDI